jgi:hypothetical protein
MTGPLFSTLFAGCICAAMLGASSAKAADGSITFSGVIAEPTCLASSELIVAKLSGSSQLAEHPVTCNDISVVSRNSNRSYSLLVSSLTIADETNDQLLAYFGGYLQASEHAAAKLVTQTYQ